MTLGLESFISWTLGQVHGSDWQDFQIQQIFMIKLEGVLTSEGIFALKIKSRITNFILFFYHGTLDKLEERQSHLMGCENYFCTQKLHPRTRKILDSWKLSFLGPNF